MFSRTFASLRYRNYRLFFVGQLISLTGSWMQMSAQQWLVYDLTGSKALLGVIAACGTAPMLLLSVIGGMTADRLSKRAILLGTQAVMMVSALVLGALALSGTVHVWHIAALALLTGVALAFDMPTRQAFVIEMVGRDDLGNAIGLNSSVFNAARIVGPAMAGLIIAEAHIGWCFILNGLSFVAVLYGLSLMRFESDTAGRENVPAAGDLAAVTSFLSRTDGVFRILIAVAVVGVFGWSFQTLVPAFARDILGVGARGYGLMLTFGGVGALAAALSVATISRPGSLEDIGIWGLAVFVVSAAVFSWSKGYALSLVMFASASYGITAFFISANTLVQMSVPDGMRGAVMGVWTLVFGGTMPLGNLQVGFLGEKLGPPWAVSIGVGVCCLAFAALTVGRKRSSLENKGDGRQNQNG